jgi:(4S)-4-hydroxy-5-phosphonooxypentane-2,3-dione isomerase
MFVTCVHVYVKPDHIEDFMAASLTNHQNSVNEAGNCRFDILQSQEDSSCFMLYEAYDSEADATAHKDTEHYKTWRATVEDWMAEPRKGVRYKGIAP